MLTMHSRYPIPAGLSRADIRVSNSRFIAQATYTPTVELAKAFIAGVREAMPDASHHVYGYVVGYGASVTAGMSDDGEPSGTAGRPVLAVVRGSRLGDVCVVVTRYFGGTLLGTGGLVKAYGDAAKAVLAELPRKEKIELSTLSLVVPYALYEPLTLLIASHSGTVDAEAFAGDVQLQISLPVDQVAPFRDAVRERSSGKIAVTAAAL
ncbi:MAG: YigZ family protein [Herpetosiphonaceae bacterium]|nr:YigZ family protein [Herpetosiphonaceae bacterium]